MLRTVLARTSLVSSRTLLRLTAASTVAIPLPRFTVAARSMATEAPAAYVTFDETKDNIEKMIKEGPHKAVITYHTATWCSPCRSISPAFASLAAKYKDSITFIKIDVDENADTTAMMGVNAMPTFMAFQDGKRVASWVGADLQRLEKTAASLAAGATKQ